MAASGPFRASCVPLRLETGPVHLTVFECSRLERDMLPAWALHKSEDSLSLECSSTLMSPRKFSNLFVPAPPPPLVYIPVSGPLSRVESTAGWGGWRGGAGPCHRAPDTMLSQSFSQIIT